MSYKKAKASSKYVRISPYKVRRVANQVRGRNVKDALNILKYLPHRACGVLKKTIESAIANLNNGKRDDLEHIYLSELTVNEGPLGRRFQPKARGRIFQILRRTCHVNVRVTEIVKEGT